MRFGGREMERLLSNIVTCRVYRPHWQKSSNQMERAGVLNMWRGQQRLWFWKGIPCEVQTSDIRPTWSSAHLTLRCNNHPHTPSHQQANVTCSRLARWPLNLACFQVEFFIYCRLWFITANAQATVSCICSQSSSFGPSLLLFWSFSSLNAKCRCLTHHKMFS